MNHIYKTALLIGLGFFFLSAALACNVVYAHGAMCRCEHCLAAAADDFVNFEEYEPEGFYVGSNSGHDHATFRTANSGWTNTASGSSGIGLPATITWSIAPDGTTLPGNYIKPSGSSNGVNEPSDLISFLDGVHHMGASPGGSDLMQRDWWGLFNSAFERWDALSGITFNYESQDDGAAIGGASLPGVLGTRGDFRIGGHSFDGQTSPTILAFNYFPDNADMVIDTDEVNRWSNPNNNFLLFRNMLMHEIGHGLGLNHVESIDVNPATAKHDFGSFLMEPTLSSRFDGPQLDDILGIHRLYGDKYEEGNGNDTYQNATSLGTILAGQTVSIGTDANDIAVDPSEVDFVSVDSFSDIDFFSFSISSPQTVNLLLTPLGPTYDEGAQGSGNSGNQLPFNSAEQSDLTLGLYDTNGTSIIEFSSEAGLGLSEDITNRELDAGNYYIRVKGQYQAAQFYQLDVSVVPEPTTLSLSCLSALLFAAKRRRRSS